ncbi:hypothetical protein [Nitratireductor luteus]|uniref:hypothetical protein n=1 Tax=Nitratireductor luteus TaxID=2976980 RepID=UPI002240AC14|nr:hypothetical protein [Nitratireductor luteus]
MEKKATTVRAAISAAVRRFPELELPIRRKIEADPAFRDMCEELAEAEAALSKVDQLPPSIRAARSAEWRDIIQRLVCELEETLREKLAAQSRIDSRPPR